MMMLLINHKIKKLKLLIIEKAQLLFEKEAWIDLTASLQFNESYLIKDDDLPIMRDLKSFLNMLTAIERATDKISTTYPFFVITIVKKIELIEDYVDFKRNYKIYTATNSILSHYASIAREIFIHDILPNLLTQFNYIYDFINEENIEKIFNFFIEEMIILEKFQENFIKEKSNTIKYVPQEKHDNFIDVLDKKNDLLLRKLFKEKYNLHFTNGVIEKNVDSGAQIIFYPEKKEDTETIKNIKLLSNGIKAIGKILADSVNYQQSNMMSSFSCILDLVVDIKKAYFYFQEFDYQAIIAEQSTPLVQYIKEQLIQVNDMLESISCIAYQIENEFRLEEGVLLNKIKALIERYDTITYELRINIDYSKQHHIYSKARKETYKNDLLEKKEQIRQIRQLISYQYYPLLSIPNRIIQLIQSYINHYYDSICIDHRKLDQYKKDLAAILEAERGCRAFLKIPLECFQHFLGYSIHYELMKTLRNRMVYLEKQKEFLTHRFEHSPIARSATTHTEILKQLRKQIEKISLETDNLKKDSTPTNRNINLKEIKSEELRILNKSLEEKSFTFIPQIGLSCTSSALLTQLSSNSNNPKIP